MSVEYTLFTRNAKVEPDNRQSLLEALAILGECDCDFNGENGIEYLWEDVWNENGFEDFDDYVDKHPNEEDDAFLRYSSNVDYLIDKVKDIEEDKECIRTFIDTWMDRDRNYYHDYDWDCVTDNEGKIIAITMSAMVGY